MRLRKTIKRNSKLALTRHWCKASGIVVILLLFWSFAATAQQFALSIFEVSGFVDMVNTPNIALDDIPDISPIAIIISAAAALFFLLILEPLKLGAKSWYYQLTDGKSLSVNEIFSFFFTFERYFGSIFLTIILFIKKLLWSILFLIIPITAVAGGFVWKERASRDVEILLSRGLQVSGTVLSLIMSFLLIIWLNRYYLAEYLFVGESSLSPLKAIKLSVLLTKDRRMEFFSLELSLIGWRILNIMILPALYTIPYISVVKSLYTRYLLELFSREGYIAKEQNAVPPAEPVSESDSPPPEQAPPITDEE